MSSSPPSSGKQEGRKRKEVDQPADHKSLDETTGDQENIRLLRAQLEEEKKLRIESEKSRIESEKSRIELEKLRNGTFYTQFKHLWKIKFMTFSKSNMATFQRKRVPMFQAQDRKKIKPYCVTLEHAYKPDTVVKDDGASARSSHNKGADKNRIWPCDVLGNDLKENQQADKKRPAEVATVVDTLPTQAEMAVYKSKPGFQAPASEVPDIKKDESLDDARNDGEKTVHGQIAHLVPASPLHASLYFNVAEWVFAITGNNEAEEAIQKAIHGCCNSKTPKTRLASTGLKHFTSNKIRLRMQKEYFDMEPNVLIIPIVEMDFLLDNWNGQGYEALFIIGDKDRDGNNLEAIASGVRLTDKGALAGEKEIEDCRSLLEKSILALAQSLHQSNHHAPKCLTVKHKDLIKNFYDKMCQWPNKKGQVPVPDQQMAPKEANVRKITFVGHDETRLGHPAPDPLLLLIKAAINWSKFYDFQLLAAGEVPDEEDELSLAAEADYLEWRESVRREKTAQEVLGMTIAFGT